MPLKIQIFYLKSKFIKTFVQIRAEFIVKNAKLVTMQKHSFSRAFRILFIAYNAVLDKSAMHANLVSAPCGDECFNERFFATYEQRCERGLRG